MPLHVLHVVPSFVPAYRYGGPVKAVYEMSRALARNGTDVTVYTTDIDGSSNLDVPLDEPVEMEGFETRYFQARSPRGFTFSPQLARALSRDIARFDILHIHSALNWPTTIAARIAHRAGVPFVIRPCGILEHTPFYQPYDDSLWGTLRRWKKRAYLRLIEQRNLAYAAALHLTSEGERDAMTWIESDTRAFIVPLGIEPPEEYPSSRSSRERIAELHDLDSQRPWVLFLSRLDPKKGLDRLIDGIPQMRTSPDSFHLLVAGSGPSDHMDELHGLVRDHGLKDTVRFLGFITGEEKLDVLRGSDMFVLPSHQENFGIAVAEAMDAELPVIITPDVDIHPVVETNEAGVVAPWENGAFLEALDSLLHQRDSWETMGKRGRGAVRSVFDWDRIASELRTNYETIVEGGKNRT